MRGRSALALEGEGEGDSVAPPTASERPAGHFHPKPLSAGVRPGKRAYVASTLEENDLGSVALQLSRAQLDGMIAHARQEAPLECCGLIGGRGDRALQVYPARSESPSRVRYRIHPEDMYRAWREIEVERGWEVVAFYHSHPLSDAYPSPTDIKEALDTGYSEVTRFIIVSLADPESPVARAFWLKGGDVVEEPLVLIDGAPEE